MLGNAAHAAGGTLVGGLLGCRSSSFCSMARAAVAFGLTHFCRLRHSLTDAHLLHRTSGLFLQMDAVACPGSQRSAELHEVQRGHATVVWYGGGFWRRWREGKWPAVWLRCWFERLGLRTRWQTCTRVPSVTQGLTEVQFYYVDAHCALFGPFCPFPRQHALLFVGCAMLVGRKEG